MLGDSVWIRIWKPQCLSEIHPNVSVGTARFEGLQFSCEFYLVSCQVRDYLNTALHDLFSLMIWHCISSRGCLLSMNCSLLCQADKSKLHGFVCFFFSKVYKPCTCCAEILPGNGEMKVHNMST